MNNFGRKKGMILGLTVSLMGLFSIFVLAPVVYASDGLSISPAVIEDNAEPGQTFVFEIKVTNPEPVKKELYLVKKDIKGVSDGGSPIFVENDFEKTGYEMSSWINLPVGPITLEPKGSEIVSFEVNVPKDASPGAHFCSVLFDQRPPELRESGAAIGFQVGAVINLKIAGDIVENAQLREFVTGKMIYNRAKVDFKARVKNLGNVLLRPHGFLEINNMLGKRIGKVSVNEGMAGVFPESIRPFEFEWLDEDFAFGRYQAILSLVYGDESKQTISGIVSFWVLPIKPILTVLGALFFFFLVIFVLVKIYIRRKMREMNEITLASAKGKGGIAELPAYKSMSKLAIVGLALLFFVVLFFVLLFFLFA